MDTLELDVIMGGAVVQNYFSLAALVVLVWDYVHTLKREIRYIWSLPLNQTKLNFLFSRYFGIGFQSINVVLSVMRTRDIPVAHKTCKNWYMQQLGAFCAQYAASQMVLSRKAFNLYGRSRRVGAALAVLHLGEIIIASLVSRHTLSALVFDPACNGLKVPKDVLMFLAIVIFAQTVLWTLIFRRLWSPISKTQGSRVDLRAGICRIWFEGDAKWTWFLLCTFYAFAIPHSFIRQHFKPFCILSWPISILSIGTCRHILSTEKVARTRARLSPPSKQKNKESMPQSSHITPLEVSVHTTRQVRCSHPDLPAPSNIPTIPTILLSNPSGRVNALEYTDSLSIPSADNASIVSNSSPVSASTRSSNVTTSHDQRSRDSLESEQTGFTEVSLDISSADIEIGSMHTTSSMNSQELRDFWNEAWNDENGDRERAARSSNTSSRGM